MSKTLKSLPLVTVLMSVHNNEKVVDRAVRSILDQSYTDFEFLIINDASTDNTPGILRSYQDERLRIINNEKNLGLTRSLNLGLEEAKGKYIARIDADDFSFPDRLEKQVDFLRRNPEFILLGTSFNIVDSNNQTVKELIFDTSPEKLYYDLFFQNMIAHSSAIFKLSEVLKTGGYDEDYIYAQDYALWLKLADRGKIWVLPEVLTLWCDDPENISTIKNKEQRSASETIFKKSLAGLKVESSIIIDSAYLHNFYDEEFVNIARGKIFPIFKTLLLINKKIISNTPDFYSRNIIAEAAYQNVADLLTIIFKGTDNKSKVISFLARNIFNLRLIIKMLEKVLNFSKKRVLEGKK